MSLPSENEQALHSDLALIKKQVQLVDTGAELQPMMRDCLSPGVRLWIRGLHAALYGEFASPQWTYHTQGPMPGFRLNSDRTMGEQSEQDSSMSRTIRSAVDAAYLSETWDGFECWGGSVSYYCIWYEVSSDRDNRWLCLWGLSLPGLLEWSSTVRSEPVPWHGSYRSRSLPPGASVITLKAIETYNALRAKRA